MRAGGAPYVRVLPLGLGPIETRFEATCQGMDQRRLTEQSHGLGACFGLEWRLPLRIVQGDVPFSRKGFGGSFQGI